MGLRHRRGWRLSNKEFRRIGTTLSADEARGPAERWGLVSGLLHKNQDDFIGWLANLVGLTQEQFDELPPSAVIDILTVLKSHEDLADFFERLSGVLSSLTGSEESSENPVPSQPTLVTPSTPSNTDTDGPTT